MALKERTSIRLGEKTKKKIEEFIYKHPETNLSDLIREALKEYLLNSEFTWAQINHEIIPFVREKFEEKGFTVVGILKPEVHLETLINKSIPIMICLEYQGKRLDLRITIIEKDQDYEIAIRNDIAFSAQTETVLLNYTGSTTRIRYEHMRAKNTHQLLNATIDNIRELLEKGQIESVVKGAEAFYKHKAEVN